MFFLYYTFSFEASDDRIQLSVGLKSCREHSPAIPSTDLLDAFAGATCIRPIKGDYGKGYTDLRWAP
jgi:hypothetical protein